MSLGKEKGKRQKAKGFYLLPFSFFLFAAQPPPPRLTQPVNDFAHVIDGASARELDTRIRALKDASGDVVVVATVPTFQPYGSLEEYAVKMFENGGQGIGTRGKDNGLLIVVAVQDRLVRVEVGYELEGFITDGFAGETIRNVMRPEFRNGNYGGGLVAGTTRIINRIAEGRNVTLQNVPRERVRPPVPRIPFSTILFVFVILLLLSRRGRRRRRYWGGGPWSGWSSGVGPFGGGFGGGFGGFGGRGGGGGGFGGFGGGRSGGGGATGGW